MALIMNPQNGAAGRKKRNILPASNAHERGLCTLLMGEVLISYLQRTLYKENRSGQCTMYCNVLLCTLYRRALGD